MPRRAPWHEMSLRLHERGCKHALAHSRVAGREEGEDDTELSQLLNAWSFQIHSHVPSRGRRDGEKISLVIACKEILASTLQTSRQGLPP